jgi:SAM-dependent methyltransferase
MAEREQRLVFGEDAELYDRARPNYPDALIDDIVAMTGPDGHVVEIGCGTGKATVQLAARGLYGVAVEADPAMAAVARSKLTRFPKWRIEESDFEEWEPPHRPALFDLVCAAQAWHWLAPSVRLHKSHSLLRAGGWLALWWNRPEPDESALGREIDAVYAAIAPAMVARSPGTRGHPDAPDAIPPELSFAEPVRRSYRWSRDYSAEEFTALLRTQSDHRMLPPEQLEDLISAVAGVVRSHGDNHQLNYVCWLWAAQKLVPRRPDPS